MNGSKLACFVLMGDWVDVASKQPTFPCSRYSYDNSSSVVLLSVRRSWKVLLTYCGGLLDFLGVTTRAQ